MKHWLGSSGLATRFGTVPLVCVLALGSTVVLEGCSSESSADGDEQRGSVGVHLDVAPGVTLNSVTYSITGNGFSKTGSIDVSGAPKISGTIGGIPAGTGYTITLTATATKGATFTGSATFSVSAGGTSSVTIHLKGSTPGKHGNVQVNGTFNVAPVIDELTVTPLSVYVASSITLESAASDPDAAPTPVAYYWCTTDVTIDDPAEPEATLTSDTPGTFTVKLIVSDGDSTTTTSSTVSFVRPESGGGGAGGGGGGTGRAPNVLFVIVDDLGAEGTSVYPELAGDSGQV